MQSGDTVREVYLAPGRKGSCYPVRRHGPWGVSGPWKAGQLLPSPETRSVGCIWPLEGRAAVTQSGGTVREVPLGSGRNLAAALPSRTANICCDPKVGIFHDEQSLFVRYFHRISRCTIGGCLALYMFRLSGNYLPLVYFAVISPCAPGTDGNSPRSRLRGYPQLSASHMIQPGHMTLAPVKRQWSVFSWCHSHSLVVSAMTK